MNDKTKVGIVGAVAVLLIIFGVSYLKPTSVTVQVPPQTQQSYGSVSSPDIQAPYFSVGGVREWKNRAELGNVASTTIYSYLQPYATTTLNNATCRIKNTSGQTQTFQIGTDKVSSGTTTVLASLTIANGLWGELVATTSVTSLTNGVLIAGVAPTGTSSPTIDRYINVNVATGTPGKIPWQGDCSMSLREL